MPSSGPSRKLLLPRLSLTEVAEAGDSHVSRVDHPEQPYFVRPKLIPAEGKRRDGKPLWVAHQFNLFPLVLDAAGIPWAEAIVFLLSRMEGQLHPVAATFAGLADDLAVYRRFLDDHDIDWTDFPAHKLKRPTYRFNGHLKFAIAHGEMAVTTARRRMGTVIAFYRWLAHEGVLVPSNAPWVESDAYVQIQDAHGFRHSKKVVTTDLSIKVPKQHDPYDGTIEDGGKLRPLPQHEQEWLVDALAALGNPEMTLIHLLSLLTGARIQTVLTFRKWHVLQSAHRWQHDDMRIAIGPGHGIDTKTDKRMVLHVPIWFYEKLRLYATSERANRRRARARGGDHDQQYLFLSQRGEPLYQSKADARIFDTTNHLRHQKTGQGVRQFMAERVLPYIREKYSAPDFRYQFHDLRATAGMNMTDRQLELVQEGKIDLHKARDFVRVRMGHESAATTDRYLNFRRNLLQVRHVEQRHEDHLVALAESAMRSVL